MANATGSPTVISKLRSRLASHLYGQIVYPLMAASVLVGIVATLVAVYFLQNLTNDSIAKFAQSATENLAYRYRQANLQMLRETRFAANDDDLLLAAALGDEVRLRREIEQLNRALDFDVVLITTSRGETVARTGRLAAEADTMAFPPIPSKLRMRTRMVLVPYRGGHVVLASSPIGDTGYRLVAGYRLDERYVTGLGVGKDTAVGLYTARRRRIATAIAGGFDTVDAARLRAALSRPAPGVREALERTTPFSAGRGSIQLGSLTYQVWATEVTLPGQLGEHSTAYLVTLVSQRVTDQAVRTTRNLIAMWSVVAVVVLVALGGWIARRVSDPLEALIKGARRIADGDFSARVHVGGTNEIAELAQTFNQMTESLKERSDMLTKKILELGTLYEMSRSLAGTLDMEELLSSVLDSVLRIFDVDAGYLVLRDRESGELAIRALRAPQGHPSGEPVGSSMSEWVVREGRPLIFNPDPVTGEGQIDQVTGARAALCVPLISSEGTIGAITIGSSRAGYRFSGDDVRLLSTIANHVTIAVGNIELFSSLQEAYLATVKSLAAAVDAKDTYTRGHSDRVAMYATLTAERMGLSHEQRIALEMAAYLHDIGKIGVPGEILLKPGRLSEAEMAQMRHHPLIGANILKPVAFPWAITPVVRHHHEAYDGSGYPAGLRGEEIPLLARILTVADSFEAMTSDRPYRKGFTIPEAIEELKRCSGTQFDPRIVSVFIEVISELGGAAPAGALALSDEIAPEEARAIFAALVDGLLASFRRLGGPRLASNIEHEVDRFFTEQDLPFRIESGRLRYTHDVAGPLDGEVAQMRVALRRLDTAIGRVSGSTLVEHFYDDALESLSTRMRHLAARLHLTRSA